MIFILVENTTVRFTAITIGENQSAFKFLVYPSFYEMLSLLQQLPLSK